MPLFFKEKNFFLIQMAAICVFAGRAWQHLFWDAPYREILWDPDWTGWAVLLFTSLSWDEYVTHPSVDVWIQGMVIGQGWCFLLLAMVAAFIRYLPRKCDWLLLLGGANLLLLAVVYLKDQFYHLGQFFEYSLQFGTPVFLFFLVKNENPSKKLLFWMKLALALTFSCHGLYALGYYPRPGTFLSMTQNILGLDTKGSVTFLNIVGVLDMVVAVGIFFPKKWAVMALGYAVVWGLVTCLARVVGNFYWEYPLESLHQWVHESVYRAPHFLVPAYLFLMAKAESRMANAA